jgi:nitrate reductase NapAB chaperone NapD
MTDFAFIPGIGDAALERLSTLTHLSSTAIVVLVEQKATLSNFLLALQNGVEILGWDPAGDLLIGAHGDSFGELQMSLDEASAVPAHYESLESTPAEPEHSHPR